MSHPLPPSFSSDQMGDYIGMESCLDLKNYEYLRGESREEENAGTRVQNYLRGKRDERWSMKKKEFPPPISLLARTENQPSHMPFVLKRYNTNDGRLILRMVRVRHHEYFKAYRSNGHLTLQLVPLDDDVLPHPFADENENEIDDQYCNAEEQQEETAALEIETEDSNAIGDFVHKVDNCYNNAEKEIIHKDAEETRGEYESKIAESSVENGSVANTMGGNGGGGGKCLNYNSVRINSSCFLGVPVPAIKPVHT
ncbi:uncharacterized protein LOC116140796 [Pistacia vera]|uniref:uncharacterized protein LOC116140796 n=1 Tax=Pistacia vera TaxID=55513 RepID=UPI00126325DA|nr:uncharacterized protein LOC116140796 [Pistacia vera]